MANDPRVYREALAGALKVHCPQVSIELVEPAQLGSTLSTFKPDLVIASASLPASSTRDCTWLLLYPGRASYAVVQRRGCGISIIDDVTMADIIRLIDVEGSGVEGAPNSGMTASSRNDSA